jgi:WD40 repeat protein
VNTGQKVFNLGPLVGHSGTIAGIAFSADGRRIATASAIGTAMIWDAASGQPVLMLHGTSPQLDVAVSPDGRHLASVGQDGSALICDATTGEVVGWH